MFRVPRARVDGEKFYIAQVSTFGASPLPKANSWRFGKIKSVSIKFSLLFCYIFNCCNHFKALAYFSVLLIYFFILYFILSCSEVLKFQHHLECYQGYSSCEKAQKYRLTYVALPGVIFIFFWDTVISQDHYTKMAELKTILMKHLGRVKGTNPGWWATRTRNSVAASWPPWAPWGSKGWGQGCQHLMINEPVEATAGG